MFREEAKWLANIIYSLNPNSVFPMLNIGSSNKKFREQEQPWIDELLFKPARTKGYSVIHADIKNDIGVDLVGDLCSLDFFKQLSEMNIQSVICSNLLEHINNREEISKIIGSIVPKNGYLFVTVPYKYPYHCDPIDTMFRPNIQELSSLFPDFKIVNGEILPGGYLVQSTTTTPILYILAILIRLMLPIYQPLRWFDSLKYALWLFKDISVSCVVLEKVN
ncbi:methyltransferase type 11 [Dolichospermum circinale CS-1225]|uniref:Methyltransferase type 11 n=1 Tax=Dolichospermum circinale CS-537/01 TaxID=3021739 RepID=A0ABT5AC40_9CYAN|nr:methyltransferase type 11 [Dolichospermum circinale]MDB9468043.1 methyltransferase type 11 [Dolichospermum circinale CS-539/09]MDB9471290.1 methyltransferase type 11 [Dolichospermum circinale CS-539]MDB9488712.1 methyltransferase type 11 [Dolichospermum circinale CS-537/01]MDB9520494.1 methyltransferase type 11 [Dolichospermum circinale CS-1225]